MTINDRPSKVLSMCAKPLLPQVVEALALELVFNEQVTKSFLSDYHKMMDVREELKPSCSLRTPNYVQVLQHVYRIPTLRHVPSLCCCTRGTLRHLHGLREH